MYRGIRTPARLLGFVCLITFGALTVSMARCGAEETSVQFYFVQITDIHFGKNDNNQRAQKAIESINHLPVRIEFVAETGDLTHEKLANESVVGEALEVLGALKVPVHHVPGNHDIVRREHDALAPIYKKTFGEFITEKEYHGVVCLFVYTEPLADTNGRLGIAGNRVVEDEKSLIAFNIMSLSGEHSS